eukprot:s2478_g14.t1
MEPDQPGQLSIQQVWEVHPSPYGVPYYYNPKTKESRWTVPTGPLDRVVPKKEVAQKASVAAEVAEESKTLAGGFTCMKEPEVECISSSCSSTSESDDVPNPLSAAERAKLKVENFKAMLQEQGIQAFDTFNAWLPRLLGDARFTAVPKSQRRKLFQRLAQSLGEGQRKLEADSRRQGREGFLQLIELARSQGQLESASLDMTLAELERHFAQDSRWAQVAAPERRRLVELKWAEVRKVKEEEEQTAARAWRSWLLEKVFHQALRPPAFDALPMTEAPAVDAALPMARRRAIYEELAAELARKVASEKKAEADEEDDLLEKRKRSRLDVAEEDFRGLLAKKIRSPLEFSWKEVTMVLDGEKLPELNEVDLETIFNEVKSEDLVRRLDAFSAALLRSDLAAETSLQEAMQSVEMEEYLQAVPQNELKKRWEDWRRFRVTEALDIFAAWLRQEPALYAAEARGAASRGAAVEELCKKLESDIRYRRLDWVPSQRMKIITARLDEVAAERKATSDSE